MKIRLAACAALALACLAAPAAAQASFGLNDFDVTFLNADGSIDTQAGSHPYEMITSAVVNSTDNGKGELVVEEAVRDVLTAQVPGLAGEPGAVERCSNVDFLTVSDEHTLTSGGNAPECPDETAVGTARIVLREKGTVGAIYVPVFNLVAPPGQVQSLGFWTGGIPVQIGIGLGEDPPYKVLAGSRYISQLLEVLGFELTLWGVPADPRHDPLRGQCLSFIHGTSNGICEANAPLKPLLTLPRACRGPLPTEYAADSWPHPGALLPNGQPDLEDPNWDSGEVLTHDEAGMPRGMSGCDRLGFSPSIEAKPTSKAASSPTGLDFSLDLEDEGLTNPKEGALAGSDIEEVIATLPEGMTANPSLAEGLGVCSEAQLARETATSPPGAGCPDASKIGTVEVETPLLEEALHGALFIAKPYENPSGSLIALYVVIKNAKLGIKVVQPLRVEPDPQTGQLTTFAEDIPQLPFSHFRLHFREGGRSPLISPPHCGEQSVVATLYPYSGGAPVSSISTFQTLSGPDEGPCPPGGVAPFHPGFEAGSVNNNAGSYSPFVLRLRRGDGEQDMTKFSTVLPPGVLGRIAGLAKCPEANIAKAKSRTGPHGAEEELADPSCPASSRIGRTLAGAGVASQLTYVPGSLYLAGPVGRDPLSVVAITPGKAGPFDVGNVVVREALTLNPRTVEVEVDGANSDPIPHILKGIPLNVRDLRVYADRPEFTLNPTNCEPSSARATLFGSFLAPLDPADDIPVGLSARYQAANCAALGFKPKLQIKLKGGARRGGHPALKAIVTPRPEDANFAGAVVTLPHSAFLDQAHIRTICTRVQFAANGGNGAGCPAGSIYGQARAWSPLLDEPLSGPVYLRSSDHNLPDLVVALHGLVNINLASRIDSFKGGIRSTFPAIPDAPVSRFILEMQGAKKGLIVNSTDLCQGTHRATAKLTGQNGRVDDFKPAVRASGCGKGGRGKKHGKRATPRHRLAAQ